MRAVRVAAASTVALVLLLVGSPAFAAAPNPSFTPGATDLRVNQANIHQTICKRGYTATVRNVSTQTKHAVYGEYGISRPAQRNYVIDHLVPLEIGGANNIKNLWPEPKAESKAKDKLEGSAHSLVCAGKLTLADAQARFLSLVPAQTTAPTTPPSTEPPTTEPPATEPPATEPPVTAAPAPSQQIVHPGAFCAPAGATGVTSAGTPMVCGPASDGRNRWHSA